jgi:hypothetical protein
LPSKTGRIAVAGVLVVALTGIVAVLLRDGGDGDRTSVGGTTTTTASGQGPSTTATSAGTGGTGSTSSTTTAAGTVAAPWRSPKLARTAAPSPWLEAWGRAKNRRTCALLVPSDAGANMQGAGATADPVNDNEGWDVYLRRGPWVIEILGLFNASDSSGEGQPFEKKWPDGSVARYGEDQGAFEAVLVIPGQSCGYRIYDSQGKEHLEFVLEHLRFVQGAP